VRDPADSEEVIDARDAATLSADSPGRAYARSGANPLVHFQSARVGGRVDSPRTTAFALEPLRTEMLGDPVPTGDAASGHDATDLSQLVAHSTEAARMIGVRVPHRPWLPPLPDLVLLDDLAGPAVGWHVPYAAVDRPDEQRQSTVTWDLANDTHLAIAGTLRSGRSSALRTLAASVARTLRPSDVHLHAIDGGSGGLQVLTCLPHTGVVASKDDPARGVRLLERLVEEIRRRRSVLGTHGFGSLVEQHAHTSPADRLPYLVLLVDSWEGVAAQWEAIDQGRPVDLLHELLREGPAVGLKAVVTGDRSLLLSRLMTHIPDRVILRLADPTDLMVAGVAASTVPTHQPAGRGLRPSDGAELQLAVVDRDATGPGQIAALRALAARLPQPTSDGSGSTSLLRLERLPHAVRMADLAPLRGPALDGAVLIGLGGDHAGPVTLALRGGAAVVAGPRRSGRSTALRTIAGELVRAGRRFAVVEAQEAPWVAANLAEWPDSSILIDDVERFADTEMEDVLLRWFKDPRRSSGSLVVAGTTSSLATTFRGLSVVARGSGQGILLNPTSYSDGDLLGVRLSAVPAGPGVPGRGLLVSDGSVTPIQVAIAD
jgi:DNA segregation ATPase FtsK/SpoIIIE, S-DNA-T family